jgi:2-polyprenyl-6-methoxyphenol hydroxylase-like FAD-dependent oxidoreductase
MARQRRALIIGGSLGGLMCACLLRRDGWQVDVFERVPDELSGRGAGIVTHPQLLSMLAQCGAIIDASIGVEVTTRIALDAGGREICRVAMRQIMTSWGRLYALLQTEVPTDAYHPGWSLARVEQDTDSVCARFEDGQSVRGDVLIGADGIRSTVRSQFLPEIVPQYAGYVAWRGLIEETALSPSTHADLFERFTFCLPPGEQVLGYPVAGAGNSTQRGRRRYNLVWYRPAAEHSMLIDMLTDETGKRHDVSIPPPLIRHDVVARMQADADALLAPQFAEIVHLTPQPFFQPIYDIESPQLAFDRVALAGDAGFVARPHVGMGVTKAGDDALALVQALRATDDIAQALQTYEAQRVHAGRAIVARARHLGAYMQAQIKTQEERAMAERYRSADAVLRETAIPEEMWNAIPA